MPKCPCTRAANIVVPETFPEDAQPMKKKCMECRKNSSFREVCSSGGNRTIHNLEQEADQHHEVDHIDTVNINSVYFNNNYLIKTANLKAL